MATRIDFDEALAHPELTKERLASGEELALYVDGSRHVGTLRHPEDLDRFEAVGDAPRIRYKDFSSGKFRHPRLRGEAAFRSVESPPEDLCRVLGTPEAQAEFRALTGRGNED